MNDYSGVTCGLTATYRKEILHIRIIYPSRESVIVIEDQKLVKCWVNSLAMGD